MEVSEGQEEAVGKGEEESGGECYTLIVLNLLAMGGVPAVLIGAVGVVLTSATSASIFRIWRVRHSFAMAARSPVLLFWAAISAHCLALMVLLHWFLLLEGQGLPCFATFWATYTWYGTGIVPYVLRAVRIVVVYHPPYRRKFAGFVKWKSLRKTWASINLSIMVFAAILFVFSDRQHSNVFGCEFLESTTVFGTMNLLLGPGFAFLLFKLSQVDDVFKVRRECMWVFCGTVLFSAGYISIQTLYKTGAIPESRTLHLIMEGMLFALLLYAEFWMLLVTVAMHDGWCGFGIGIPRILPTEVSVPGTPSGPTCDGVLEYVQEGGQVAAMFEHFCTRNLCAESWDFIVAAHQYQSLTVLEEQFDAFTRITKLYLQPASPEEVNISSKVQAKIASLQGKETFSGLDEVSRRGVLQEPLKEIVKILEDNLLAKFKQSPGMQRRRQNLARQQSLLKEAIAAGAEGDTNMRQQLLLQSLQSSCASQHEIEEADP